MKNVQVYLVLRHDASHHQHTLSRTTQCECVATACRLQVRPRKGRGMLLGNYRTPWSLNSADFISSYIYLFKVSAALGIMKEVIQSVKVI